MLNFKYIKFFGFERNKTLCIELLRRLFTPAMKASGKFFDNFFVERRYILRIAARYQCGFIVRLAIKTSCMP
jgi:hypothetical protein